MSNFFTEKSNDYYVNNLIPCSFTFFLLTGLEQKINELNKKYQSTKRDRRNLENQLQVAIKTSDRTSSNLKNIEKKIELENETAVDYSAILNQKPN